MTKKKKYFVAGAAALLLIAAAILISTVGLFGISYERVETDSKVLENDVFIAYYPDFTEPVRRSFFYFNDEDILISVESKEIKGKFCRISAPLTRFMMESLFITATLKNGHDRLSTEI